MNSKEESTRVFFKKEEILSKIKDDKLRQETEDKIRTGEIVLGDESVQLYINQPLEKEAIKTGIEIKEFLLELIKENEKSKE